VPGMSRYLAAYAAVLLAGATALGAYASHALAGSLQVDALHSFETAVVFQSIHALGLLALAALTMRLDGSTTLRAGALAVAVGVVLFCGGVYASSLGGPALIARVAPFGGTLLIMGWLAVGGALVAGRRGDT
jgi:uncharacterized membrane protein YgdD (TMEM256/DUF423 family)